MLTFLENNLKLDASGLTIGGSTNNVLVANLTLDQRSTAGITSFPTIDIYNEAGTIITTNLPFTITLALTTTQNCTLQITFNQPLINVNFNLNRKLTIHANTGDTYDLYVEIDYSNPYSSSNWVNSTEALSISDTSFNGPLTSLSLNNILRSLLVNTINALNQARLNTQYYFFKNKYLSDIIDFAIEAGSTLESSTCTITLNSDGTIASILKVYVTGRYRTERILITYNYASYTITRIQKRSGGNTNLESSTMQLINSFRIDAVDSSNNIIYNLGQIAITRSTTPTIYSVQYLNDYNVSLLATDPSNIMADYKYYQTNTITGWTVIV